MRRATPVSQARRDGTRSAPATSSPDREGTRVRTRLLRAATRASCGPASTPAGRRARLQPPVRRAACSGWARATTAARRRRGSGRRARPAATSAPLRGRSREADGRVRSTTPPAPCSRGRSVPSRRRGGAARTGRRNRSRTSRSRRRRLEKLFQQRAPSSAEYLLACSPDVRLVTACRERRALALCRRTEDAERAAARMQLVGQPLVLDPRHPLDVGRAPLEQRLELAAADDAERELGRESRRLEHGLEPVQRNQLADEDRGERRLHLPAGTEDALLRADEAHLDAPRAELAKEPRVGAGV